MISENMRNKLRGVEKLRVENTNKTRYRFDYDTSTLYIPISEINFCGMFSSCICLSEITLCIDNKIAKANGMFSMCNELKEVNFVKNLNLEEAYDLTYMFYGCVSLEKIDLSNIIIGKNLHLINMMFSRCVSLKEVNFGKNFHTENITQANGLFFNCYKLEVIKSKQHPKFKNLIAAKSMFEHCRNLKFIDLRGINFNNLEESRRMFNGTNSDLEVLVNTTFKEEIE